MLRSLAMKKTQGRTHCRAEHGFSLIELLIAMVVTLIVSGTVVSLLAEGNKAFRIQPDLTERQQNIRVAMDTIMRDVANAGASLPMATQVFARRLKPNPGDAFGSVDNTGIDSPYGGRTDILEMLSNTSGKDPIPA